MADPVDALRDRLANLQGSETVCPVQRLYGELDEETAAILKSVIDGPTPMTRIHAEIRASGLKLAKDSLSYHRKGICRCAYGDSK